MHFKGIKPQQACRETWGLFGNKSLLCDQRKISAEAWAWSNSWNSFASHIKPQACSFSPWVCKSLWSVKTSFFFFFFNIKHNYINEIHSKIFELSDQKFMLLLLPSEDTAFLHCYCINLCSVLLHLMLVKSKLDKAVITCFYLLFLDSFSSGSVIIWQVNMKLLKFIFQIQVPNVWWHAQWTSGNAHSPLPFQWGLG